MAAAAALVDSKLAYMETKMEANEKFTSRDHRIGRITSPPCKFHARGVCRNGDSCPFLHEGALPGSEEVSLRDAGAAAEASSTRPLAIGDFVIIHDLQGAKELNGLPGEIVRYMAETSRFGVRLPGCVEPRAVKPDNLRRGVGRVGGAPALVEESMPKDLELLPNGRRRCRLHENPLIDDQSKLWYPFCVWALDWNSGLASWS